MRRKLTWIFTHHDGTEACKYAVLHSSPEHTIVCQAVQVRNSLLQVRRRRDFQSDSSSLHDTQTTPIVCAMKPRAHPHTQAHPIAPSPVNTTQHRLRKIQHHPPMQLPLFHLPKHIPQPLHLLNPHLALHQPPPRKIQRLNRLAPIPHRHPHNPQRL